MAEIPVEQADHPPARRDGRLTAWIRRRPRLAVWTAAGAAFLVGAGVGAAGAANQEEIDRLEEELARAEQQRDQARDRAATAQERLDAANERIGELTAQGEVPDFTGRTVDEAKQLGEAYQWRFRTVRRPSDERPGTVIAQQPAEGRTLERGRSVTLVVAAPRPKSWKTIFSLSGAGSKRSDEFEIPPGKVRIRYSFSGNTNAILYLKDPEDELNSELLLNEIGNFSDTTRVYGHEGTRYLEVDGGTWNVEVQVYK